MNKMHDTIGLSMTDLLLKSSLPPRCNYHNGRCIKSLRHGGGWIAPQTDKIFNYRIKKLTALFEWLAVLMNKLLMDGLNQSG